MAIRRFFLMICIHLRCGCRGGFGLGLGWVAEDGAKPAPTVGRSHRYPSVSIGVYWRSTLTMSLLPGDRGRMGWGRMMFCCCPWVIS